MQMSHTERWLWMYACLACIGAGAVAVFTGWLVWCVWQVVR